ncbi:hypothetical protein E5A76_19730 [Photobacterium sp. CAIM 1937]|nr:hypothetical protein [Photobacterium lucens]MZG82063.1 hypothetical protein [Photobacterium lucens]
MFNIAPVYLVNNHSKRARYAQANIPSTPPNNTTTQKTESTTLRFHGYDHRGEIQPQTTVKGCTINVSV